MTQSGDSPIFRELAGGCDRRLTGESELGTVVYPKDDQQKRGTDVHANYRVTTENARKGDISDNWETSFRKTITDFRYIGSVSSRAPVRVAHAIVIIRIRGNCMRAVQTERNNHCLKKKKRTENSAYKHGIDFNFSLCRFRPIVNWELSLLKFSGSRL